MTALDARAATRPSTASPNLPAPRGPLTAYVVHHLTRPPHELSDALALELVTDATLEDRTLALYLLYELHYASFAGVDDGWEWHPSLLALRATLERRFEIELVERVGHAPVDARDVVDALNALAGADRGPSLSAHMCERGTLEQFREFAVHRSAYQLKEADPHTWAIPRLRGRAKAAIVEIQADEYGKGVASEAHAELFAATMRALGLDDAYGAYLDRIPATTLATVNLISMLGLHRRWRGALVGHLALFEMCSVAPMARYARAVRRLGVPEGAEFYDVHVVADAHHELVARYDMAGALAADEPELASDIVFGARALQAVEHDFASYLLDAWRGGRSSLLPAA